VIAAKGASARDDAERFCAAARSLMGGILYSLRCFGTVLYRTKDAVILTPTGQDKSPFVRDVATRLTSKPIKPKGITKDVGPFRGQGSDVGHNRSERHEKWHLNLRHYCQNLCDKKQHSDSAEQFLCFDITAGLWKRHCTAQVKLTKHTLADRRQVIFNGCAFQPRQPFL
jgi:hypothetical protein